MPLPEVLKLDQLREFAEDAVSKAAKQQLGGAAKRKYAARQLGKALDAALVLPGALELLDGPLFTALASAIIEGVYREMHEAGRI